MNKLFFVLLSLGVTAFGCTSESEEKKNLKKIKELEQRSDFLTREYSKKFDTLQMEEFIEDSGFIKRFKELNDEAEKIGAEIEDLKKKSNYKGY